MWLPRKDSSVCRKHFRDEDFVTDNVDAKGRTRKRLQLKPRARPTEYLRTPPPQISNLQKKKMEEDQIRPGPSGEHNYPIDEGNLVKKIYLLFWTSARLTATFKMGSL